MKSFELIRKYMNFFGISRRDPNNRLKTTLNTVHFVNIIVYILASCGFTAFEAETFSEYSESLFYNFCALLTLWWYLIYVLQSENFVQILDDLDEMIEKSEFFLIYDPGERLRPKNVFAILAGMQKN